ncbi:MAG TPA: hypothetical protein VFV87_06410, partial [Pirellulaceae bacterium]|nr:hypothetical protein [Pirellulaceae bacterium]
LPPAQVIPQLPSPEPQAALAERQRLLYGLALGLLDVQPGTAEYWMCDDAQSGELRYGRWRRDALAGAKWIAQDLNNPLARHPETGFRLEIR